MCDMPIPFGAEFDASSSGGAPTPFEQSSRDNDDLKSSQIEPIRSAYISRYTQSNGLQHAPIYRPYRKSPQASESLQTFSYYPSGSYAVPPSSPVPQQDYYFTEPPSNQQSMHQMYGRESLMNYQQQQLLPRYQYQPVQLKASPGQFSLFQDHGIIDPRVANGSYEMGRNSSHGTCEKCGSFCSSSNSSSYNSNFMTMSNSEPQRFAQVGSNSEMPPPSRPYRSYYPPNPTNRKHRNHILF